MSERHEYRFRIDAFRPDNLPMARLAEYMAELARLYGDQDQVHFDRLEPGSAILVTAIELPVIRQVGTRLQLVREGRGSRDALRAFKAIDNLLERDNAVGVLTGPDGAEVIPFPGRTRPKPLSYGPFAESGTLDGVVIQVGGRQDNTVPVILKNGDAEFPCRASVPLSIEISGHYRRHLIRVHGSGRWMREEDRTWTLKSFDIDRFEVLDDAPLSEVIERLHAVEGGAWGDDPSLMDLLSLRRDVGDKH